MPKSPTFSSAPTAWPQAIFSVLKAHDVRQVAHVPDAGHAALIRLAEAEPGMRTITLTTEEEGVALAAGAWLGGQRSVLLMQSSGVGNCINMLALPQLCGFPFFAIVTMRGEWGEFNGWQVPMGRATPQALALMGIGTLRADHAEEVRETLEAGARMAYLGGTPMAVLLSQRLIGFKTFGK
jgi:sulfopyruvate decarboxylase alpha subunit